MLPLLRQTLSLFAIMTLLTGLFYPAAVTGLAQLFFSEKANGSLQKHEGRVVGSYWVGQPFDAPRYFWGRPSATPQHPYNAMDSSGSNLGPAEAKLRTQHKERVQRLRSIDPTQKAPVPVDLVAASASGLDPHITPAAARYQAQRIARERKQPLARIHALIQRCTEGRQIGFLGEPRVHVLCLNRALDSSKP